MRKIIQQFVMISSGIILIAMYSTSCRTQRQQVTVPIETTVTEEKPLGKWYKCNTCNETGRCVTCKGSGKVSGKACKNCDGKGDCPNCYGQGGWHSNDE